MRCYECSYCGGNLPEPYVELTPTQRKLYERLKLGEISGTNELNRFFYGPNSKRSNTAGYSILQHLAKNLVHSPLKIRVKTIAPYCLLNLDGSPYTGVAQQENNAPATISGPLEGIIKGV